MKNDVFELKYLDESADFLGDNLTRCETSWNACYAFCKILNSEKHLNFYGCTRYSFKMRERTNALKDLFMGKIYLEMKRLFIVNVAFEVCNN